jgi:hypothetical protein
VSDQAKRWIDREVQASEQAGRLLLVVLCAAAVGGLAVVGWLHVGTAGWVAGAVLGVVLAALAHSR